MDTPTSGVTTDVEARLSFLASCLPPVVCFANDWSGDPTSKHHLMRQLSRYTRVIWVEASGMRVPKLTSAADWLRMLRKLRGAIDLGKRSSRQSQSENVTVISPLTVPIPGNHIAEMVNFWIYRRALRRLLGADGTPLMWVYTPTVAPHVDKFKSAGIVYHCVDRWWEFTEYDSEVMRRCHRQLCDVADLVLASSVELMNDCIEGGADPVLLRHGVDWDHFASGLANMPERPYDLAHVPGKIIGFFGLLHDWIDQELLLDVAKSRPRDTVVLIGKARTDIGRLLQQGNVVWLGQKPFTELPTYAAHFDVALIPFELNALTLAVNPIKLLEYLSAGVPTVATALPEIVALTGRPGLHIGRSSEEFTAIVNSLLDRDETARRSEISAAQREDSWAGRCVIALESLAVRLKDSFPAPLTSPHDGLIAPTSNRSTR
jgi:glycosyltransferase involved in cell wall biosynthesis